MLCCVAFSVNVEPLHALGLLVEVVVLVLVAVLVDVGAAVQHKPTSTMPTS